MRYLARLNPDLASLYATRPQRYADELEQIHAGRFAGVSTAVISPLAGDPIPARLETDHGRLALASVAAQRAALTQLASLGIRSSGA